MNFQNNENMGLGKKNMQKERSKEREKKNMGNKRTTWEKVEKIRVLNLSHVITLNKKEKRRKTITK